MSNQVFINAEEKYEEEPSVPIIESEDFKTTFLNVAFPSDLSVELTLTLSKSGNTVILEFPPIEILFSATTGVQIISSIGIPAKYRSKGDLKIPVVVIDNLANIMGYMTVDSADGKIRIYKIGGNFTASTTNGLEATDICYASDNF